MNNIKEYMKLEETKQNYINKLHEHRLKILEIQKQLILIESQIKN